MARKGTRKRQARKPAEARKRGRPVSTLTCRKVSLSAETWAWLEEKQKEHGLATHSEFLRRLLDKVRQDEEAEVAAATGTGG